MNEWTTWMQNNWYELGNLLLWFAFLVASVWFARKYLRTMRASQEQIGALLKLTVAGSSVERPAASAIAERTLTGASPYWLTPEPAPISLPETAGSGPSRWAAAGHGLIVWLQTPMSSGGPAPWRRAIKWLQAPAGS
jgi:hypothetical protein